MGAGEVIGNVMEGNLAGAGLKFGEMIKDKIDGNL